MTAHTDKPPSKRAQEQAAMLKEALARPGVREVMRVYGGWRQVDGRLDVHRAAIKRAPTITTTDYASPQERSTRWKIAMSNRAGIRATPQAGNAL